MSWINIYIIFYQQLSPSVSIYSFRKGLQEWYLYLLNVWKWKQNDFNNLKHCDGKDFEETEPGVPEGKWWDLVKEKETEAISILEQRLKE